MREKELGVPVERACAVSSRWTVRGSTRVTLTGVAQAPTSSRQAASAQNAEWLIMKLVTGPCFLEGGVLGHTVLIRVSLANGGTPPLWYGRHQKHEHV